MQTRTANTRRLSATSKGFLPPAVDCRFCGQDCFLRSPVAIEEQVGQPANFFTDECSAQEKRPSASGVYSSEGEQRVHAWRAVSE
ncbi:MAG: hypothetical protein HYZ50_20030 [Deltaproteobacteria bacterium]|nr:hypothetical protein [Deltaproteobacteria bacterium]